MEQKMKRVIKVKEFIQFVQKSNTREDVSKRFGISMGYVTATMAALRRLGAKDLKKFHRPGNSIVAQAKVMDKNELNRIAAEALKYTYAK